MEIERRIFDTGRVEVRRASPDSKAATIRGYAAVFNSMSEDLGGFREQIAPGAFDDVLENDVRCFFNHDENIVLGRTLSGTLRLSVDDKGLAYEVDMPDTQCARDLLISMDRGDVSQSSFGFRVGVNGDTWDENDDGVIVRTITKFGRLFDVSPVSIPAYPDTTSGVRSLQAWQEARNAAQAKTAAEQKELRNKEVARRARLLRLHTA